MMNGSLGHRRARVLLCCLGSTSDQQSLAIQVAHSAYRACQSRSSPLEVTSLQAFNQNSGQQTQKFPDGIYQTIHIASQDPSWAASAALEVDQSGTDVTAHPDCGKSLPLTRLPVGYESIIIVGGSRHEAILFNECARVLEPSPVVHVIHAVGSTLFSFLDRGIKPLDCSPSRVNTIKDIEDDGLISIVRRAHSPNDSDEDERGQAFEVGDLVTIIGARGTSDLNGSILRVGHVTSASRLRVAMPTIPLDLSNYIPGTGVLVSLTRCRTDTEALGMQSLRESFVWPNAEVNSGTTRGCMWAETEEEESCIANVHAALEGVERAILSSNRETRARSSFDDESKDDMQDIDESTVLELTKQALRDRSYLNKSQARKARNGTLRGPTGHTREAMRFGIDDVVNLDIDAICRIAGDANQGITEEVCALAANLSAVAVSIGEKANQLCKPGAQLVVVATNERRLRGHTTRVIEHVGEWMEQCGLSSD